MLLHELFFRYEVTGITEEHLRDAMPLKEVQDKILQILYNGESIWRLRLDGGKARILVGHGLEHDLDCLRVNYPDHMLRWALTTCDIRAHIPGIQNSILLDNLSSKITNQFYRWGVVEIVGSIFNEAPKCWYTWIAKFDIFLENWSWEIAKLYG